MKRIVYFADMLRSNKISVNRPHQRMDSLESLLYSMGGRLFTNCITPAPDTPRSLGIFLTGKLPLESGLSSRTRYPGPEIQVGESVFSAVIQEGIPILIVSENDRQSRMLFPSDVLEHGMFFVDMESLIEFFQSPAAPRDCVIFVVDNDYHNVINERLGHPSSHLRGVKNLSMQIGRLIESLKIETPDQFVLFSDHGCKFANEPDDPHSLLDRDRSQFVFFHTEFGKYSSTEDNRLLSMQDFSAFIREFLSSTNGKLVSTKYPEEASAVHVEDFTDFGLRFGATVESWALFTPTFEYFSPLTLEPKYVSKTKFDPAKFEKDKCFAETYLASKASNYSRLRQDFSLLVGNNQNGKNSLSRSRQAKKRLFRLAWASAVLPLAIIRRIRRELYLRKP